MEAKPALADEEGIETGGRLRLSCFAKSCAQTKASHFPWQESIRPVRTELMLFDTPLYLFFGSPQGSDEKRILGGFSEDDKFDVRDAIRLTFSRR
jgi:hypothetical protein